MDKWSEVVCVVLCKCTLLCVICFMHCVAGCHAPASDLAATTHTPLLESPAPLRRASDMRLNLWQSIAEEHPVHVQQFASI